MTCTHTDTPATLWEWELDDLGPHADLADLRRLLASAPPDAPADLVQSLREVISKREPAHV